MYFPLSRGANLSYIVVDLALSLVVLVAMPVVVLLSRNDIDADRSVFGKMKDKDLSAYLNGRIAISKHLRGLLLEILPQSLRPAEPPLSPFGLAPVH